MPPPARIQCVFVGGDGVGKTTLLNSLAGSPLNEVIHDSNWTSSNVDPQLVHVKHQRQELDLFLVDTIAEEGHDRLRPLCYPRTDFFILCFSLGDRRTLRCLIDKWAPEIHHHWPQARWILVGNWKFEFSRYGGNEEPDVSNEMVQRTRQILQRKNGRPVDFISCDAKAGYDVQAVTDAIVRIWIQMTQPRSDAKKDKTCIIM